MLLILKAAHLSFEFILLPLFASNCAFGFYIAFWITAKNTTNFYLRKVPKNACGRLRFCMAFGSFAKNTTVFGSNDISLSSWHFVRIPALIAVSNKSRIRLSISELVVRMKSCGLDSSLSLTMYGFCCLLLPLQFNLFAILLQFLSSKA